MECPLEVLIVAPSVIVPLPPEMLSASPVVAEIVSEDPA